MITQQILQDSWPNPKVNALSTYLNPSVVPFSSPPPFWSLRKKPPSLKNLSLTSFQFSSLLLSLRKREVLMLLGFLHACVLQIFSCKLLSLINILFVELIHIDSCGLVHSFSLPHEIPL